MAFTAEEIKNLALMELNHETISDWTDTNNTDIPIIDAQYGLAKSVALTMYQWSWAFKYAKLTTYEYHFDLPVDWKPGTTFYVYTDSTEQTELEYVYNGTPEFYTTAESVYIKYIDTEDAQAYATRTGTAVSDIIGKYKKATFLPDDFAGYLSCYTNKCQTILADYITVGDVLYTNADEINIKYIGDVDEAVFTPEFVDWFKIFLAQRLNGYLNGDMQRQQLLSGEEPFYFRKAKNIDSKRNKHDSLNGNPLLWVRGKIGGAA